MPQELAVNKKDLKELILSDQVREQLMSALPRYYNPDQFAVIVRTALNKIHAWLDALQTVSSWR